MKCLSCSRSAKFQIPNNPRIVFCDKICQFDYVNGKREREEEEESFFDNNDFATEFLLRVEPLDLINSELVNTKFRALIFTVYFMKQYVELHEIPDEFMWWIYTKTRPKDGITREIEFIVNSNYEGFFKNRSLSPGTYLKNACQISRIDIVENIFRYKTKIPKYTIFWCLEIACTQFNLRLFDILISKTDLNSDIAGSLLNIICIHQSDQSLTVKKMFLQIYNYCLDLDLSRVVFYFLEYDDLLEKIFQKIQVEDSHLAEIIWEKRREYQIMYLERILKYGTPKSFELTLNAIASTNIGGSENEVYRFLKNKFNL